MITNKSIFIGRITKDVEVSTSGNKKVAKFNIAIDNGKDGQGQKKKATFPRLTAFDKVAETFGKYGKKGVLVAVEARYEDDSYERNGETIYTHDFIIDEFKFLTFPESQNQQQPDHSQGQGFPGHQDHHPQFGGQPQYDINQPPQQFGAGQSYNPPYNNSNGFGSNRGY